MALLISPKLPSILDSLGLPTSRALKPGTASTSPIHVLFIVLRLSLLSNQSFRTTTRILSYIAYFNRMLPTLQCICNHADRSQVLRQFCVGGASDEIKNWQQRVDDQRIRRKRKWKVDKTDIKSLREVSICNFLEAFRFQADSYDGVDLDQFDAAIIDVDKLTDLQVEVELRVRNEDASGSSEECRKRLKDIIATEAGEEDNDAVEALPAVEQDDQESDHAPPYDQAVPDGIFPQFKIFS